MSGQANLHNLFANVGVAQSISVRTGLLDVSVTFNGVQDLSRLRNFLDLLTSVIIMDLPPLEECYALGPYTVFGEEQEPHPTPLGTLMKQAKYRKNISASTQLLNKLQTFVAQHPGLRGVQFIAAAPKSDFRTPDLPLQWAQGIANSLGYNFVQANKVRQTEPQKDLGESESEESTAARVADSMKVGDIMGGADVLILDDTIRSGGTMKEMARALRTSGADKVFGLSACKDARFTRGGVALAKERWQ